MRFNSGFLAVLFSLLSIFPAHAQEIDKDSTTYEINGRHFHRYIVQQGNTLYSISRAYSVTVQEIEEFNPGVKNGLSIGDTLHIPAISRDKPTQEKRLETDANAIVHEVQKKQTLYAISKIYGVSTADIIAFNPGLTEGLTEGQLIRIPVLSMKQQDTSKLKQADANFIRHEVKAGETLYSISKFYSVHADSISKVNGGLAEGLKTNSIILIPRNKGILSSDTIVEKKDVYKVVYIMPLFLDINDTIMAHLDPAEKAKVTPKSLISLQFYEGAMIAIDSLDKLGMNFNIRIFDSAKDSNVVSNLIAAGELADADLIIGPFFMTEFMRVSAYARKNKIHIVCPVPQNNKVLLGNPHASKVAGSRNVMSRNLGRYVASIYRTQNIIIIGQNFRANALALAFKNEYLATLERSGDTSASKNLREVRWDNGSMDVIKAALKKDTINLIVVQSDDQVYVSELATGLSQFHKDYMIKVIGIDQWLRYTNIDYEYYENIGLMVPSDGNVNYTRPEVRDFVRKFEKKHSLFPEKFSFQGFDISFYYLKLLHEHGRRFEHALTSPSDRMLYYRFKFFSTGVESGYENESTILLKQENFELQEVTIPD